MELKSDTFNSFNNYSHLRVMDKGDRLIKKPVFKGGKQAMRDFIKKHLKYPDEALADRVKGMVRVRIDIDQHGKVSKCKVIKKLGYGCDEEAMRVAKLLEFHVDSKRKVNLTFHKNINFNFSPPPLKKKKAPPKPESNSQTSGMQIVYTYVPKKKSQGSD